MRSDRSTRRNRNALQLTDRSNQALNHKRRVLAGKAAEVLWLEQELEQVDSAGETDSRPLIEDAAASCFLIGSSSSTATAAALREQYPNMQAATVLAKVWCLQRGFLRGHDTFSTDLIVHLLIYLFRTKQTN